jgi:hypothetical protein
MPRNRANMDCKLPGTGGLDSDEFDAMVLIQYPEL